MNSNLPVVGACLQAMPGSAGLWPAALAAVLTAAGWVGAAPAALRGDSAWGRVAVHKVDDRWEATLQNSRLSMTYGRVVEPNGTKDRIVELSVLVDGRPQLVGVGIDTRHTNGNQAFFVLTDAQVLHDGAARKTVRLTFGNGARVQDVSIYPDSRVFTIEYLTLRPSRHACDLRLTGDTFYAYGAEEWQKLRGWPLLYPKINDKKKTGDEAYYRSAWGSPGPLAYKGRFIVGRFQHATGIGFGSVLSFDQIDWFKFTRSNGLERMMKGAPYTVHHFVVTGGAEEIRTVGQHIADGKFP